MGFFSSDCRGCNQSIKSPYDMDEDIRWQNEMVCLSESTEVVIQGNYDGYGRTDIGGDIPGDFDEWWHKKCWISADRPKYTKASNHAQDQGFFY